jgi:hypothetical protein
LVAILLALASCSSSSRVHDVLKVVSVVKVPCLSTLSSRTTARLYSDLSATNFGKNILGVDKEKLADIYKLWILAIDDTTNSLFSNGYFFE